MQRIQSWKLYQTSIDDILPLLKLDYQETKKFSNAYTFTLTHRWALKNGNQPSPKSILELKITDDDTYKYLPVLANIQILTVKAEFISLLPSDQIWSHKIIPVIFYQNMNGLYAAVSSTSSSYFSRIRSTLLRKKEGIGKDKKDIWGEYDIKYMNFSDSFFYWLMNQQGKTLDLFSEEYKLETVNGFSSAIERRHSNFTGNGANIVNTDPVKIMVCYNNRFTVLKIMLKNDNCNISFSLSESGEVCLEDNECHKITNNGNYQQFDTYELILKLYLRIIPGLFQCFNSDKTWDTNQQDKYRKKIGIESIRGIIEEHNLQKKDVVELFH